MAKVLITGANRGLGLEFVRQYSADGWDVLACCRNPSSARDLSSLAESSSGRVKVLQFDVCSAADRERIAAAVESIDLLINNAGVFGENDTIGELANTAVFEQVYVANAVAPLLVTQSLLPAILKGEGRKVAFITSKMGSIDDVEAGRCYPYRMSKCALNMGVVCLAKELANRGVVVGLLHPGWVQTDMGGENGLIKPPQSISGMRKVIAGLTPESSGTFHEYNGEKIAW